MSQKIYREVILQWNEKTNQYDTIYEDSYDYDGPVDLAKKTKQLAGEMGEDFDESFEPSFEQVTKTLTKAIEDGAKKASRGFGGSIQKSIIAGAQVAFDAIQDLPVPDLSFADELTKAAASMMSSIEGALQGTTTYKEIRDAGAEFEQSMKDAGLSAKEIENRMKTIYNFADKLELKEMEKNFADSVEQGLTNGLGFIPSNSFTQAIGLDAAIQVGVAAFAGKMRLMGGKLAMWMKGKWGAALAGAVLIGLVFTLAKYTDQIGDAFGSIGTGQFTSDLKGAEASAAELGLSFEDATTAINELSTGLGIGIGEAAQLSESVMDTAKATGISVDEASKLTALISNITGNTTKTADDFLKTTALMATANNVAPAAVLADISNSSEEAAKFTKGMGDNIAEGAVRAAQLGISLGDVAKVADGLLNFQESLTAEMEASAIIGRNLNLSRARELALAGDLVGLQDEILNQVGSEAEFNAMNAIQRQALADAIGINVAQLARMTQEAGKSKDELMGMREFSGEELIGKDAMSNLTRFMNMIKKIGLQILSSIGEAFQNVSEEEIQETIEGFKTVGTVVANIAYFLAQWGPYLIAAYAAVKIYNGLLLVTVGLQKILAKIRKKDMAPDKGIPVIGKMKMSDVIKGAGAIAILAGAMVLVAFAFSLLGPINYAAVFTAVVTLVVLGFVARMLGNASKEIIKGAIAIFILGLALIPAAFAFSLLEGVSVGAIIGFSIAIIVLAFAMIGLGFVLMYTLPFFLLGVFAILILGAALIVLGIGLALATPFIIPFVQQIMLLAPALIPLIPLAVPMFILAVAIVVLAYGLMMASIISLFAIPVFIVLGFALTILAISLMNIAIAGTIAVPILFSLALAIYVLIPAVFMLGMLILPMLLFSFAMYKFAFAMLVSAVVLAFALPSFIILGFAMFMLGFGLEKVNAAIPAFGENSSILASSMNQLNKEAHGFAYMAAAFYMLGPALVFASIGAGMASVTFRALAFAMNLLKQSFLDLPELMQQFSAEMAIIIGFTAGIIGLSMAITGLAASLAALAITGALAIPILFVLGPLLSKIGMGEGSTESTQQSADMKAMRESIEKMQADIHSLLLGFTEGDIPANIGKETGKNVKGNINAEIKPSILQ